MPYTNDPANNPIDRIRLNVGDIWPDIEILADADYQYFLDAAAGNENRATMDAARAILFKIGRYTRERTGDIEVYGGEWFDHYYKALQMILKDPNISISIAVPYAGGISKADMLANRLNPDTVQIGCMVARKPLDCCSPYPVEVSNGFYF
jgi:hypothetical protein